MAKAKKKSEAPKQAPSKSINPWFLLGGVLLATLLVTGSALKYGFTNWDDGSYVLDNYLIKSLSGGNLRGMFTETVMGNHHPLTVLSLAIDYALFGLDPTGYHATNLLLHLACTALVFVFFFRLSGRKDLAAGVALLFGIHPMHMETVAWISDRKDLLYTLFFLGGMVTYLRYLLAEKGKVLNLSLTLVLFAFSLLSKATAVTFPVVLLGIDFLEKRSFNLKLVLEKVPFLALSVVAGLFAVGAQQEGEALKEAGSYSFLENLFVASWNLVIYLVRVVIPFKLSAFHPYPARVDGHLPIYMYFMPVVVLGLAFGVYRSLKHNREVAFGAGFFIVTIALLLQLLPVGDAIVAERYTYLPYLGLFYLLIWGGLKLSESPRRFLSGNQNLVKIAFAAFVLIMGGLALGQLQTWKDSGTLWSNVIKKYPEHYLAYNNRGNFYGAESNFDLAFRDFNLSLKLNPNNSEALTNRGRLFKLRGKNELALKDFEKALTINPKNYVTLNNRGNLYRDLKKYDLALADFNQSIALKPTYDLAWNSRGALYRDMQKLEEALADFNQAVLLNPGNFAACNNRGIIYEIQQNYQLAIREYSAAISIRESYKDAWINRSRVFWRLKDYKNALDDARKGQQFGAQFEDDYIKFLESQVRGGVSP
ncbi:MAG: tetratricopeptide repeat protein [Bacteroidia bacterium]|nr:tetratricopeptide repeat protein [Bacteroidia bacterium]